LPEPGSRQGKAGQEKGLLVIGICILKFGFLPEAAISRILGLDVGDARIGLALSDPIGILASPYKILVREKSPADLQAIIDIARDNKVSRIIVGLPVNMNGTTGGQAEKVREFVNELSARTDIPIEFRDERLTTVQAKHFMQSSRKPAREMRYDAAAAALILQSYLDDSLPPKEVGENDPGPENT